MEAEIAGAKIVKTKLGYEVDGVVYQTLDEAVESIDWA